MYLQKEEKYPTSAQPCGSGQQVVYAWAKNAPELDLPDGVGFRVGGEDSEIDWLVLQVRLFFSDIQYVRKKIILSYYLTIRFIMLVWIIFLNKETNLV